MSSALITCILVARAKLSKYQCCFLIILIKVGFLTLCNFITMFNHLITYTHIYTYLKYSSLNTYRNATLRAKQVVLNQKLSRW